MLERYLCCFISESDIQVYWPYLLQITIIAINRDCNAIIKMSLFFALYGYKLEFYLDIAVDIKEKKILNAAERI